MVTMLHLPSIHSFVRSLIDYAAGIVSRLESESAAHREQLAAEWVKREEALVAKHAVALKELKRSEARAADRCGATRHANRPQ